MNTMLTMADTVELQNYTNLSAGNHTVDVRDANGCVFSTTIVITREPSISIDVTPTTGRM
jgi:hypothetical protein